jgi:CheY-like chemotaxis protein
MSRRHADDAAAPDHASRGDAQLHVLVVNDTVAILELFVALLEDEGYRVSTDAFSIEMLPMLDRVKTLAPDLVVLDFVIGDEGKGWQFLQMLRMDRQTARIPVLVCSAAAKLIEELLPQLDEMGVGVVLKPFDIDDLLGAVSRALGHARQDGAEPVER